MKRTNDSWYRWVILAVAFSVQLFCSLSLYGMSPLGPYIRESLHISNTQFGLLFTVSNFGTMIMLMFTGNLVDSKGVRLIMTVGQVVMGFAVMAASLVGNFAQLTVLLFIAGICQSVAGPTGAKAVTLWFRSDERATAMGIKQAGIPAAGVFAGVLLPTLAFAFSWRIAIFIAGILILLSGIICCILYKDVDGFKLDDTKSTAKDVLNSWKQVMTKDIVILSVGCGILMGVQFTFSSYLVNYLTEVLTGRGFSQATVVAGSVYSLASAGGFAGRLGLGLISDRLFHGRRKGTLITVNILGTVILLLMTFALGKLSLPLICIIVLGYGLTGISFTGLQLSMVSEMTKVNLVGAATGFTLAVGFVGMMLVPLLFGTILDASGAYFYSWMSLFVLSAIGSALLFTVKEGKQVSP